MYVCRNFEEAFVGRTGDWFRNEFLIEVGSLLGKNC